MYVLEGIHSSIFNFIFLHRYFLPVEITNTLNDNLKVTPGNQVEQLVKPVFLFA